MSDMMDGWYEVLCRSRARQGITMPPFRWRYLLHLWGWRWYVWRPVRQRFSNKKDQ